MPALPIKLKSHPFTATFDLGSISLIQFDCELDCVVDDGVYVEKVWIDGFEIPPRKSALWAAITAEIIKQAEADEEFCADVRAAVEWEEGE